mmetsp:Transcript_175407/g.562746  ORF Transcript_175407/g.562746 Transcript_175407/m.562746 type:complete len:260 (+) Transcript_175407:483-1262(+)
MGLPRRLVVNEPALLHVFDVVLAIAFKGQTIGANGEASHTQRPHINLLIVGLLQQLGGHVENSPDLPCQFRLAAQSARAAKVCQLNGSLWASVRQQIVLRLHIPVDEPVVVQEGQPVQHLPSISCCHIRGQSTVISRIVSQPILDIALDTGHEITTCAQVHDEVIEVTLREEAMQLHDVRVIELTTSRQFGFHLGLSAATACQRLQGEHLACGLALHLPNLAEPPLAQPLAEVVVPAQILENQRIRGSPRDCPIFCEPL